MSVLAILLEASSLPFVQQPCYLVPVCKCLCTPFGKRPKDMHCSLDSSAAPLFRPQNSFAAYAGLTPFWMGSRSIPSEHCWASAMTSVCCCVPGGAQLRLQEVSCLGCLAPEGLVSAAVGKNWQKLAWLGLPRKWGLPAYKRVPRRVCMTIIAGCQHCVRMQECMSAGGSDWLLAMQAPFALSWGAKHGASCRSCSQCRT